MAKSTVIGDYRYTCRFIPWQYKLAQEIEFGTTTAEGAQKRTGELSGMYYIDINIDLVKPVEGNVLQNDVLSEREFNERLYYMSYLMQNDLVIHVGEETRPCALYLFERNFGLKRGVDFTAAFERKDGDGDITIEADTKILGTGILNFVYNGSELQSVPELKL